MIKFKTMEEVDIHNLNISHDKNRLAPIVLFVYNRVWHTKNTIEALQNNELASESELFVYSDGPKNEDGQKKIEEVRDYIKSIKGFKKVNIIERGRNLGLAKSIIEGVTEILHRHNSIIVLEDDLVTSPFFLQYMNDALLLYEHEDKVMSIHGYIYPVRNPLPETFFLKKADCLGWATWKRAWNLYESDGQKLLNDLIKENLTKDFDFRGTYPFTRLLKEQIAGKNNSWAVRWYASTFLNNSFTLYPGRSLVNHIYNDEQGTHCSKTPFLTTQISGKPIKVEKIPVEDNSYVRKEIEKWYKTLRSSRFIQVKNMIKRGVKVILKYLNV